MDGNYGYSNGREALLESGERARKMSKKLNIYFAIRMLMIVMNIVIKGVDFVSSTLETQIGFAAVARYISVAIAVVGVAVVFWMATHHKMFIAAGIAGLVNIAFAFVKIPDTMGFRLLDMGITMIFVLLFCKAMQLSLDELGSNLGSTWHVLMIILAVAVVAVAITFPISLIESLAIIAMLLMVFELIVLLGGIVFFLVLIEKSANDFRDCAY